MTRKPDDSFMVQAALGARSFLRGKRFLICDRDAKFTGRFDKILRQQTGTRMKRLPPCSPNLNAHAERFIQTLKHECLNHFIVFGERLMNYLVEEFVEHYHMQRTHQGIGGRTPVRARDGPRSGPVRCESKLGGVLKHYYRAA